jgi:hypothetical protein
MTPMSKVNRFLVAVLFVTLTGPGLRAEDWKVGEKWTYQHAGPRPYSDPPAKVEGDRTMKVTAIEGQGNEKRYLLKNRWGTTDVNSATSYIDAKNMIRKIDIQDLAVLLFDPPVPAIWKLKVGEEKTLKTQMDAGGFVMAADYKAKRLKDETVTVPAGTYEKCHHIQVVLTIDNPMGLPIKSKVDHWYHPRARNAVKEVTVTNFGDDNAHTGTSVLKSHTRKDSSYR